MSAQYILILQDQSTAYDSVVRETLDPQIFKNIFLSEVMLLENKLLVRVIKPSNTQKNFKTIKKSQIFKALNGCLYLFNKQYFYVDARFLKKKIHTYITFIGII